jgi:hypothetical protein
MVNQTQEGSAFAVSVRPPETPPGPQPVLTWTEWERDTAFAISGYTASNGYVQVPVNYAGHWEQNFYAGQLPTQPDSSTEFNYEYRYYVTEAGSPFGYELVGYTYTYGFETGAASEDVEPDGTPTNGGIATGILTAINQQQGSYELPMTGGPGTWPFALTGSLMVFGAALLLLRQYTAEYRRKRKKPAAAGPRRQIRGDGPARGGDPPL